MDEQNAAPTPTPIDPTPQHIEELQRQEQEQASNEANEKHKKEKKSKTTKANIFIVISLVIILIVFAVGYMILNPQAFPFMQNLLPKPEPEVVQPEEEMVEEIVEEEEMEEEEMGPQPDEDGNLEFISKDNEFRFKYPFEARLIEPGAFNTPLETYLIIFEGEGQDEEVVDESNLKDGYIVSITIHQDVIYNDLDNIAIENRNRYLIQCPESTTISRIGSSTLAGYETRTFLVENCGVTFEPSYLIRDGDLIEVNKIYRGDLGVRQVYKNKVQEIVNNFRIINTIKPTPVSTWNEFTSNGREYTIKYPVEMDTTCCTLRGPISDSARKIFVIADPNTVLGTDSSQFNGLGIYQDRSPTTFDQYVDTQKDLLEENYRIVIGRNPVTNVKETSIDGKRAVVLEGYAWWGDLTFVELSERDGEVPSSEIMIIVKSEVNEGIFDDLYNELVSTIEFRKDSE